MVCGWMAEVTRVRRPKPQNDPRAYTLASLSQCAYQDNCANNMSATCRCGMSFVMHFALCTWASETSMDGKTPMLVLSWRRLECQRSIFHCPRSKAGHWIVPLPAGQSLDCPAWSEFLLGIAFSPSSWQINAQILN